MVYSYPALYFYLRHKIKTPLASAQPQLQFFLKTNPKLTNGSSTSFLRVTHRYVNQSSFMEALNSSASQATFSQVKMGCDLVGLERG